MAILKALKRGPLSVGAIVARIKLSQPAVSHHLRILKEARLVTANKAGTTVYYSLDENAADVVCCCVRRELDTA